MNHNVSNVLWDEFEFYCGHLSNRVRACYESRPLELTVTLDDGSVWIYDNLTKRARKQTSLKEDLQDDDAFKQRVAHNLQFYMHRYGYNQQTLSEVTGLSQGLISSYARGTANPSMYSLCKIADVFGVSVTEFLRD